MRLAIGCDHLGWKLKKQLIDVLERQAHKVEDLGCGADESIEYPDIAEVLALLIARGEYERGILICGTGIGMAIAANKVPGVRATQLSDRYSAERAAKSNNANIASLGAQTLEPSLAIELIEIWLASEFQGGRSAAKVPKIDQLDRRYRKDGDN